VETAGRAGVLTGPAHVPGIAFRDVDHDGFAQFMLRKGYRIAGPPRARLLTFNFRATSRATGRPVAIKLLNNDDAEIRLRFAGEVQALRRLRRCPLAARLVAHGNWRGMRYLVTRWFDGPAVDSLIAARLPAATQLALACQIARTVRALHRAGVAHRDLSPEHIFVLPGGRIGLIDFGVAGLLKGGADDRAPIGKDIASLGLVLCELLSGKSLFHYGPSYLDDDARTAVAAIGQARLPGELRAALLNALAARTGCSRPDGSDPFRDMDEFLRHLESCFERLESRRDADLQRN
jgi:serine/threonine protein kinase